MSYCDPVSPNMYGARAALALGARRSSDFQEWLSALGHRMGLRSLLGHWAPPKRWTEKSPDHQRIRDQFVAPEGGPTVL